MRRSWRGEKMHSLPGRLISISPIAAWGQQQLRQLRANAAVGGFPVKSLHENYVRLPCPRSWVHE